MQYRDGGEERTAADDVHSFTRYAAYRDQATPEGRLFDADGTIGDEERRALVRYIRETTGQDAGGRAFYRMVISPENASGVDLRELTRRTMAQLQKDCGHLPPWIAAEHRNTSHAHVHVIMAARHKEVPGRTRTLIITRPRLERMKQAMTHELTRQHDRPRTKDRSLRLELAPLSGQHSRSPTFEESVHRMARGKTSLSRALTRGRVADATHSVMTILASTFDVMRRVEAQEMARRKREQQQDEWRAHYVEEENQRRRSRGRSR